MVETEKRKTFSGWSKKAKDRAFILAMLAIPVLHFAIFYVYINFNSILMAFQTQLEGKIQWGFQHFERMFTEFGLGDSILSQAFINTLTFWFTSMLVILPISFVLCYFLYKKVTMYRIYRVIFYLPSIIPSSVTAILFKYMIAGNGPIAEIFMSMTGTELPTLLTDSTYAMKTLLFYNVFFGLGTNMVLFSGAMSNIDSSIIEAVQIDGANMFVEMTQLVIPMMWPTLSTVMIFDFVGLFNASGPILLLTKGAYNTYTISYWIYDRVLFGGTYNYPAAVGLFFTLIGAPIALFMRWLLNHGVDDITM